MDGAPGPGLKPFLRLAAIRGAEAPRSLRRTIAQTTTEILAAPE
jgi:hypothetical protein